MQTTLFDANHETNKKAYAHESFLELVPFQKDEVTELFYSFHVTEWGKIIIAGSKNRIHWISFIDSWRDGLIHLNKVFPGIMITEEMRAEHEKAQNLFLGNRPAHKLKLYPIGTEFQIKVWSELLKIPVGETMTYGEMANRLKLNKGASRAVGTAIGKNPIAFLIPCHRVLQASGKLGGYRWGIKRKAELLKCEMV